MKNKRKRKKRGARSQPRAARRRRPERSERIPLDQAARVDLRIDSLAWGGDAIATHPDGRIVFVDSALPQQMVRVALIEEKKRFWRGVVTEVLDDPTPTGPACPTAQHCGGCRFQGVSYAQELQWKMDALHNMLQRLGKNIEWPEVKLVSAASPQHYRSRVRLRVNAQGQTGYLARGSHDLVPAIRCDVLHPALESARQYAGYLAANLPSVHGVRLEWDAVRHQVVIEVPTASDAWDTVRASLRRRLEDTPPPAISYEAKNVSISVTLRYRGRWEALCGDGQIFRAYTPALVEQKSGQFSQANTELNHKLRTQVAEWTVEDWNRRDGMQYVVDLFSGAGNLAFAIADKGARVVAIDHASDAVDEGEVANTKLDGARVARWVSADLNKGPLVPIEAHLESAHAYVLDPPRGGLEPLLIDTLAHHHAQTLVYVSCDPAAFARDAQRLANKGWAVQKLQAWDMFPRTAHVELLAKFTRKG